MNCKIKYNKGAALLLSILIMAALLAIAIGVSRLTLGEVKMGRNIPESLTAYYVAEAGMERALYEDRHGGAVDFNDCLDPPDNNICYEVQFTGVSPNRTIKSNGSYRNIRRTVEITY